MGDRAANAQDRAAQQKKSRKGKKIQQKGKNFYLTIPNKFKKYFLAKRLRHQTWIEGYVLANETGSGYLPNNHTHAIVITKEKMNNQQFRNAWKNNHLGSHGHIEHPKNLKTLVKYITKEDYRCIVTGVDKDMTSVITKAYICSNKWDKLHVNRYPYCAMSLGDQKKFRDHFADFQQDNYMEFAVEQLQDEELRRWQKAVRNLVKEQNNRKVLWIVDEKGGQGKSFLGNYLETFDNALYIENGAKKDVAYLYQNEPIVAINYIRSVQETMNYGIIENIKDGRMLSAKYESRMKRFRPAKVVAFSNFKPDKTKLSEDRWMVFDLVNGRLTLDEDYNCPLDVDSEGFVV